MANRNIQISLAGGVISYTNGTQSANQFHIKPTNKLSWNCDDGDYSILFKGGRSPFKPDERAFAAHQGKKTTAKLIKDFVGGGNNTFSYAVTVIDPMTGQAHLDDPDVIIDDPGGGGGGHSSGTKRTGSTAKKKKQAKKKK